MKLTLNALDKLHELLNEGCLAITPLGAIRFVNWSIVKQNYVVVFINGQIFTGTIGSDLDIKMYQPMEFPEHD